MKLLRFILQHKWQILSLSALMIFRGKFIEWITEYVCPVTSYVVKDSWWVLFLILATVGILYAISYRQIQLERKRFVSRYWAISWLFFVYLIFRVNAPFEYYGIGDIPLSYIDYVWMSVLVIEIVLYFKRTQRNEARDDSTNDAYPFLMDTPVDKDEMGRGRYAEQLVDKIIATYKKQKSSKNEKIEGAFTILLNEHYGVGKTSFMFQLQKIAENKGLDVCWFKPWLYDDDSSLIVNLIHVLQEKLGEGDRPLSKMLDRYARVLSSVEKYEWVSVFQHDTTSIETRFEEIKEKLHESPLPIIVLIDDVDRLQNEELMRMLQMVRNMADFPYVYYIIAGDKSAIMNRLKEAQIAEPYEYLKKFFNLEISFPGVDDQVARELEKYIKEIQRRYQIEGDEIIEFIRNLSYKTELFANIRDVKRYVNLLDFDIANIYRMGLLGEVCLRDVAGLCIIQSLDTEFYQLLRDHNDYILRYPTAINKFYVKEGFKKALDYSMNIREAASRYGTADASVAQSGTMTLETPILPIGEVIKRSQVNKTEIIIDILYHLFPDSTNTHSRIGICYPTEYYKYFSATYKKTEMTNAEIIGLMEASDEEYADKIQKIINDNRILAYIHKMEWFVNSQKYRRLDVLEKMLMAFAKHYREERKKQDNEADTLFDTYYDSIAIDLFKKRDSETEEQSSKEWGDIYKWLTSSKNYSYRILILQKLIDQESDANRFIYESRDVLRDCVHASANQYIDKVWSRDKYNQQVYGRLDAYRKFCNRVALGDYVTNKIVDLLLAKKTAKYFLYHLVEPYREGIKWNTHFMECVIGSQQIRAFREPKWQKIVPEEWLHELASYPRANTISPEEIEKSLYLQAALRYWNSKKKQESNKGNIEQ